MSVQSDLDEPGSSRNRDEDLSRANPRRISTAMDATESQIATLAPVVPPLVKVGVFWDYENVRIPPNVKATVAANHIRSAVLCHGQIVERRLYFDSRKRSEENTDRVSLDQAGFTLVDCPTRNAKETLDKKLIVDIMSFAFLHTAERSPSCVVLITSDGDYSYTISKVRDLGVKTVVIHGPQSTTAGILLDVCEHALSWKHDVLCISSDANQDIDEATENSDGTDELRHAIEDALDGRHITLCHAVLETSLDWVEDAKCANTFHRKRGVTDKALYTSTRKSAIHGGFIEVGRRDLQDKSKGVIALANDTWDNPTMNGRFSLHSYLRITEFGKFQLEDTRKAANMALAKHNDICDDTRDSVPLGVEALGAIQLDDKNQESQPERSWPTTAAAEQRRGSGSSVGSSSELPLEQRRQPVVPCASRRPTEGDAGAQPSHYPHNYKTVLCEHFGTAVGCRRGSQCTFAHGESELRIRRILRMPCRDWFHAMQLYGHGRCSYGDRCSFSHDAQATTT